MGKKSIAVLLIVLTIGVLITSCVTQPRFSDYIGYEKEEALDELGRVKTGNTVKLVLNWVLWGWIGLYIPSIVDTINYVSYLDDFRTIEGKIEHTQDGLKVGQ